MFIMKSNEIISLAIFTIFFVVRSTSIRRPPANPASREARDKLDDIYQDEIFTNKHSEKKNIIKLVRFGERIANNYFSFIIVVVAQAAQRTFNGRAPEKNIILILCDLKTTLL